MREALLLGNLAQLLLEGGAAGAGRLLPRSAEVVANLVVGDPPQPATERVARTLAAEGLDVAAGGEERLLRHVLGRLRRKPGTSTPAEDDRLEEMVKPLPAILLARLELAQQGGAEGGAILRRGRSPGRRGVRLCHLRKLREGSAPAGGVILQA